MSARYVVAGANLVNAASGLAATGCSACTGAKNPGPDREPNWLPAPNGTFSLYIRAYWGEQPILDGTWQPPKVLKY